MGWPDKRYHIKIEIDQICSRKKLSKQTNKLAKALYDEIKEKNIGAEDSSGVQLVYLATYSLKKQYSLENIVTYGFVFPPALSKEISNRKEERIKSVENTIQKYLRLKSITLDNLPNEVNKILKKFGEKEQSEETKELIKRMAGVHYHPITIEEILRLSLINAENIPFILELDEELGGGKVGVRAKEILKNHILDTELKKFQMLSVEFSAVLVAAKENNINLDFSDIKKKFYFYNLKLAEKEVNEILPIAEKLLKGVKKWQKLKS